MVARGGALGVSALASIALVVGLASTATAATPMPVPTAATPVPTSAAPTPDPSPAPTTAPPASSEPVPTPDDETRDGDDARPLIEGASARSFRADDIISDANMYDPSAMTAAEVQAFLRAQVPTCGNARCLAQLTLQAPARAADADCKAYAGGRQSAASVIAAAGAACGVSQKALLALIEKESGLVTSAAPTQGALDAATGYFCLDDGNPCQAEYRGFVNQVYGAARQLASDRRAPQVPVGEPVAIRYSPDESCGSGTLTLRTVATAALYAYTPYQPNDAALESGNPGDDCSSFGNLNFWVIYTDWFGYAHIDVDRLRGADRFEVAVAIARDAYPDGASTLYLANGLGYADALSAGPAASRQGAPLLLTLPDRIPEKVGDYIRGQTGLTKVVVVGGTAAISEEAVRQVSTLRPGVTIERIGGVDRYDVSREVAARVFGTSAEGAYIATGTNFPDALGASAAGGHLDRPVVLVYGPGAELDPATADLLTQRLKVRQVTIAGGTASVSPGLQSALAGLRTDGRLLGVKRIAGADRFEVSLALARDAFAGDRADRVLLATGLDFPDALAGSALAGAVDGPLVVVRPDCVSTAFRASLKDFDAVRVTLLGGANSLAPTVESLTPCS